MSESDEDLGVTPAKQRKRNEPEQPKSLREEPQEPEPEPLDDFAEIRRVVVAPEIVIEPPVYLEPAVLIELGGSSDESADAGQSSKEEKKNDEEQNQSDNNGNNDNDGNEEDLRNVKHIVIVSEIDSDNGYEEEEWVGNDASDRGPGNDNNIDPEPPINVNLIQHIFIPREEDDSDDDSFFDGGSEDSDAPRHPHHGI